ncbi:MAG: DHA2 family efflux MFS transporter permease subunit [Acidimicrobiales bacterium]
MPRRDLNQKVAVAVVYVAAMFMAILDTTIVNVALPTLGRDFHVSSTALDTVVIGFLVSLAVFIPASGWLGDRFGPRRVLLTAIFMFTAASALCGVATSLSELTAFRVLQGVGGGLMTPVGMTMLWRAFPPAERIRASAILVVPTALAPALGPVLGGLFVTDLSWRWVFFVNVPIGLLAIAFGTVFLREQPRHPAGRFDLPGFVMAGVGLGLLMYGLSEGPVKGWASPDVATTCISGAVLLAGLVAVELRRSDPLIALRLLRDRLFRSANIVMFCGAAAFLGMLYLAALFFQDGLGLSALGAGLTTFPEALGVMAGAQLVTRILYPRLGPRRIMMSGLAGVAIGMVAMSFVGDQTNLWLVRLAMLEMGISMSGVFVPTQAAAFATISPADTGRASTFFNAERQLGGAIGVAVLTTVLSAVGVTSSVAGHATAHLAAYHMAFLTAAAFALVGAGVAATIKDADAANTITRRRAVAVPARETGDELAAQAKV